jgi:hypothetical protein
MPTSQNRDMGHPAKADSSAALRNDKQKAVAKAEEGAAAQQLGERRGGFFLRQEFGRPF